MPATILHTAAQTIAQRGQERDTGDGKERTMAAAVAAFNALEGTTLTERQGWAFMKVLKAARAAATARLIAAAPEMLEALGRIEALYSNLRHGGPAPEDLQSLSDALEEACDIARDAIELAVNGAKP